MLTHAQIWSAIDRLAERAGLSASGLARRAGLDPTTFNKSKRMTAEGRARWPSTELIAKALTATGTPVEAFVALMNGGNSDAAKTVPLLGFAQAGSGGYFDDAGFPAGEGWDQIAFPEVADTHAYALKISGQSMLPAYRDGDVILVSPSAPVRRGDRVVVKTRDGEVMAKELKRRTPSADRASLAQCRARGPHAHGRGGALDGAHSVGESVGFRRRNLVYSSYNAVRDLSRCGSGSKTSSALKPTSGQLSARQSKPIFGMSRRELDAVGLKGCADSDVRNPDCARTMLASSTKFRIRAWKSSQSSAKQSRSHG